MKPEQGADGRWSSERLTLKQGFLAGLVMAIGFSIYAVGLLGVFLIVSVLGSSDGIMTVLPRVLLQMVSVVVGYFAAFSLGGVLFAALSAMRGRILGYTLTGFLLGSTIYGCVAVAAELAEAEPPDWTTVREFTLLMGVLWGVGGTAVGIYRRFPRL